MKTACLTTVLFASAVSASSRAPFFLANGNIDVSTVFEEQCLPELEVLEACEIKNGYGDESLDCYYTCLAEFPEDCDDVCDLIASCAKECSELCAEEVITFESCSLAQYPWTDGEVCNCKSGAESSTSADVENDYGCYIDPDQGGEPNPVCPGKDDGAYCDGEYDCETDLCDCQVGQDFCNKGINPCVAESVDDENAESEEQCRPELEVLEACEIKNGYGDESIDCYFSCLDESEDVDCNTLCDAVTSCAKECSELCAEEVITFESCSLAQHPFPDGEVCNCKSGAKSADDENAKSASDIYLETN